jgi:hypothetical protein
MQLSDADRRILQLGRLYGIRVLHENGETIFVSGRSRLRRQSVLWLLQLGYLVAANDGLFGADSAQTILVNITPAPRFTSARSVTHRDSDGFHSALRSRAAVKDLA